MIPSIQNAETKRMIEMQMLDELLAQEARYQNRMRVVNPQPRLSEMPSDALRGILDLSQGADKAINEGLDYYLGNTGIPDKLRLISGLLDPGIYEGGYAAADMIDPRTSDYDRMQASQSLSMLAALAPMAFIKGKVPTRQAAPGGLGDTAAATYQIGDYLAAPSQYAAPAGRPSKVNIPGAGVFEARPINAIEQAATEYMQRRGMDTTPITSYPTQDPARARLIASAYDMMKHDPGNPDVRRAYDALIQETLDQYNALRGSGIEFKFLREGMDDPYARSPAMGYQDLVENGRLWVFPTDFGFGSNAAFDAATNPLLTRVGRIGDKPDAVANDAFRAVHDTFGHFGPGNPFFRAPGEERAWLEHSRMYSPEARGAMTSETRGQNSWLNFGPYAEKNRTALGADTIFADQKTGLLDPWAWETFGMPSDAERAMLEANMKRWMK